MDTFSPILDNLRANGKTKPPMVNPLDPAIDSPRTSVGTAAHPIDFSHTHGSNTNTTVPVDHVKILGVNHISL